MIKALFEQGLTREQIVTIYVDQLGFTKSEAEFAIAIELGEVSGDVIAVDDNGEEVTP